MSESSAGILTSRYGALALFSHTFKRTALEFFKAKEPKINQVKIIEHCTSAEIKKKRKIIKGVAIIRDLAAFFFVTSYRPRFFCNCDVVDEFKGTSF